MVSVSVDRIGGGFGGKGSKSAYWGVAVAIASKITKGRVCLEIPLRQSIQTGVGKTRSRILRTVHPPITCFFGSENHGKLWGDRHVMGCHVMGMLWASYGDLL